MKDDKCTSCEDGNVYVECCGRCNEMYFIGICNWCNGTGLEIDNPETNIKMINDACKINKGYFCGYDPSEY